MVFLKEELFMIIQEAFEKIWKCRNQSELRNKSQQIHQKWFFVYSENIEIKYGSYIFGFFVDGESNGAIANTPMALPLVSFIFAFYLTQRHMV